MPSFISSSSPASRIPQLGYARIWCLGCLLFILMVLLSELGRRAQGHQPSLVDNEFLWAINRDEVYGDQTIVIAGSSRAQLGIDPKVIEEMMPGYRVIHLAIDGTPGFEVVKDLVEDERFRGVILWSAKANLLGPARAETRRDRKRVNFYQNEFKLPQNIDERVNTKISSLLQGELAICSTRLSLQEMLKRGFSPPVTYINLRRDRFRPARYFDVMTDIQRTRHRKRRAHLRTKSFKGIWDEKGFEKFLIETIAPLKEPIVSRGGKLILLRMPTSGEHWVIDEKQTPRELFWNNIMRVTGIPTIHFKDHSGLVGFECPDTSHLDARDAEPFSRELSEVLIDSL